jgi:hypothetical protein
MLRNGTVSCQVSASQKNIQAYNWQLAIFVGATLPSSVKTSFSSQPQISLLIPERTTFPTLDTQYSTTAKITLLVARLRRKSSAISKPDHITCQSTFSFYTCSFHFMIIITRNPLHWMRSPSLTKKLLIRVVCLWSFGSLCARPQTAGSGPGEEIVQSLSMGESKETKLQASEARWPLAESAVNKTNPCLITCDRQ